MIGNKEMNILLISFVIEFVFVLNFLLMVWKLFDLFGSGVGVWKEVFLKCGIVWYFWGSINIIMKWVFCVEFSNFIGLDKMYLFVV